VDEERGEPEDALLWVDGRGVPYDVFRANVSDDRAGAAALHHLEQWVLPAIAALTRSRSHLSRAAGDPDLCQWANAMSDSDAHWLHVLLGVQLDAVWLVLCPLERRGFRVLIDGIATNFELHTLVADALVRRGIPGKSTPQDVIDFLCGRSDRARQEHAVGVFNLYDWRAAAHNLADPNSVPDECWVWCEGAPRDVAMKNGTRIILVGPEPYARSWNLARPFSALTTSVMVQAELSQDNVLQTLANLRSEAVVGEK
jgi:hypothetical protein